MISGNWKKKESIDGRSPAYVCRDSGTILGRTSPLIAISHGLKAAAAIAPKGLQLGRRVTYPVPRCFSS